MCFTVYRLLFVKLLDAWMPLYIAETKQFTNY